MKLFVMTGQIGCGKTTWIRHFLQRYEDDLDIAGVYTPAVFEGDTKTAIDAELLPTHERFLFAPRKTGLNPDGTQRQGWDFQDDAMSRINEHLASSVCQDCELLIIDEFGWLELFRNEGYVEGLRLIDSAVPPAALLVIREDLLEPAHKRWGEFTELSCEADPEEFFERVKVG